MHPSLTWLRIATIAAGVLAGATLGWLIQPSGAGPSPDAAGPPEIVARDSAPDAVARVDDADCGSESQRALSAELDELDLERRLLEGLLLQVGGVPLSWPDASDAARHASEVRAALDAASPGEAYEILEVDCSEPPCVVGLEAVMPELGAQDDERGVIRELAPALVGWAGAGGLTVRSTTTRGKPIDGRLRAIIVLRQDAAEVDADLLEIRADRRQDRLMNRRRDP